MCKVNQQAMGRCKDIDGYTGRCSREALWYQLQLNRTDYQQHKYLNVPLFGASVGTGYPQCNGFDKVIGSYFLGHYVFRY